MCVDRAEPVLARIKEDYKRIILPSIDNIKHDTFEVERYENSGHGYNWELWCMYINPPKQWWEEGDASAPIRHGQFVHLRAQEFIFTFVIFGLVCFSLYQDSCNDWLLLRGQPGLLW